MALCQRGKGLLAYKRHTFVNGVCKHCKSSKTSKQGTKDLSLEK